MGDDARARREEAARQAGRRHFRMSIDRMVLMYFDGLSMREVARQAGCSHGVILRALKERGLSARDRSRAAWLREQSVDGHPGLYPTLGAGDRPAGQ